MNYPPDYRPRIYDDRIIYRRIFWYRMLRRIQRIAQWLLLSTVGVALIWMIWTCLLGNHR